MGSCAIAVLPSLRMRNADHAVKRREFLKNSAVWPAGLLAAPLLLPTGSEAAAQASPLLAVVPSPATPAIVRAGSGRYGESHRLGGRDPVDLKLSSNDTGGALAVWESVTNGMGGPSYHVHHDVDEWFFVIAGEFAFKMGDTMHDAHPGDSIFVRRGVPHTWSHRGTGTGRLLFLVQPAGLVESFFRGNATRTRTLTQQEAEQFFEAHGMTLLGPPLPLG